MFSTFPSELTFTTQTFSINHVIQHIAEECYLPLRTEKILAERELRRKATPTRGSLDKAPVSLVIMIANAWNENPGLTGRDQQAARTTSCSRESLLQRPRLCLAQPELRGTVGEGGKH